MKTKTATLNSLLAVLFASCAAPEDIAGQTINPVTSQSAAPVQRAEKQIRDGWKTNDQYAAIWTNQSFVGQRVVLYGLPTSSESAGSGSIITFLANDPKSMDSSSARIFFVESKDDWLDPIMRRSALWVTGTVQRLDKRFLTEGRPNGGGQTATPKTGPVLGDVRYKEDK